MALDPRTPVLVGGGQVCQRVDRLEDARSPAALMAEAARAATADAGLAVLPERLDSIRVVNLLAWHYRDPARFVADGLGITAAETAYTTMGGNAPQMLVNATARDIQRGDLDLVLLAGGETWRTRTRARKDGVDLATLPGWPTVPDGVAPTTVIGSELVMNHPGELALGLRMPVQIYPMFETAIRASAGRSVADHQIAISELWARFAGVAVDNPYAWVRSGPSAETIRTPSPTNRMIGFPYPKLMNSNLDVDQAAALLMCSVERARALGVPEDRWIFPQSGTDCHEHYFVSNRWSFAETPAVARGAARALELAGTGADDLGIVDLYSCFPSAVQLGAASIGLAIDSQLTRTGGLSFAGGPWNNYPMHAIATVMGDLRRADPGTRALVWANGGYATKHAFGVYATTPPANGFAHDDSFQAELDEGPRRELAPAAEAAGPATIEAYSVMHDRDGRPEHSAAACLLADGRRAWAVSDDRALGAALCADEWVGRTVTLSPDATLLV
jgi:acetyl-CoA C-acetyltransferase